MRNKIKIILGLFITIAMMLSTSITAFATVGSSITIENAASGHTYKAYQLFNGSTVNDTNDTLDWGISVSDGTALITALKNDATIGHLFTECVTAEDVAKAISPDPALSKDDLNQFAKVVSKYFYDNSATPESEGESSIDDLRDGYYIVMDGESFSYMLQVTENVTISPKSGIPTVEKKVHEDSTLVGTDAMTKHPDDTDFNDVADWDMGQTESFKLYANLPAEMWGYDAYKLEFNDTFSKGITVTDENGNALTGNTIDGANYKVTYIVNGTETGFTTSPFTTTAFTQSNNAEGTIKFSTENIKTALAGVGVTSGEVTIAIEYYAELNANAVVGTGGNDNSFTLTYTSGPDTSGSGTSETQPDEVTVFTFEIDGTKVDSEDETVKLEGAEFILGRDTNGDDAADEWATVDTYGKITGWIASESGATKVKSLVDTGKFNFTGVDSGTYILKETKAPEGYNTLDEEIVIVVESVNGSDNIYTQDKLDDVITGVTYTIGDEAEATATNGIVPITVKNSQGSKLPETGDTGRVVFYAVGSIGTALCLVFLITKRRMNKYSSSK